MGEGVVKAVVGDVLEGVVEVVGESVVEGVVGDVLEKDQPREAPLEDDLDREGWSL